MKKERTVASVSRLDERCWLESARLLYGNRDSATRDTMARIRNTSSTHLETVGARFVTRRHASWMKSFARPVVAINQRHPAIKVLVLITWQRGGSGAMDARRSHMMKSRQRRFLTCHPCRHNASCCNRAQTGCMAGASLFIIH